MKDSLILFLPALVLILTACDVKGPSTAPAASTSSSTPSGNRPTVYTNSESVVDAPANYVGAVLSKKLETESRMELLNVRRAIDSFREQEERPPVSLNELVEKGYLKVVPQPPRGQSFHYNSSDGSVRLVPAS